MNGRGQKHSGHSCHDVCNLLSNGWERKRRGWAEIKQRRPSDNLDKEYIGVQLLLKILPILMLSLKLFSNKKLKYTLLAKVVLRVLCASPRSSREFYFNNNAVPFWGTLSWSNWADISCVSKQKLKHFVVMWICNKE